MTAHFDPTALQVSNETPTRFELKLHEIPEEQFLPIGDRYIVETIAVDEMVKFGSLVALVQDPNIDPRDPRANPQIENRGVIAAVVIRAGNGHLLGIPDWATAEAPVMRTPANVPMFMKPGDVVLIDRNAKGRALRYANREIRVVGQIDVLVHIEGIRLVRKDGEWVQEDVTA